MKNSQMSNSNSNMKNSQMSNSNSNMNNSQMNSNQNIENLQMTLLSSNLFDFYSILNQLIAIVNEFADLHEYVVIKKRIKINKKEVIRKEVLMCDKDDKYKHQRIEKRATFSRQCECFFETVATLKVDD